MKTDTWIEVIDGKQWRVQRVTGEIARILTGRNSYLVYRRVRKERKRKKEEAGREVYGLLCDIFCITGLPAR